VQDPVVVGLGDTDELAVVALCAHDAAVVQLVHGWADPEAVAEVQLLKVRKKTLFGAILGSVETKRKPNEKRKGNL
jgi:hypothetical protein